jgi:hypothetical protein
VDRHISLSSHHGAAKAAPDLQARVRPWVERIVAVLFFESLSP